jgi:cell division septum initiation protein DivIVA
MGLFGSKENHDLEVKQVTMTVGQAVADLRNEIHKRNEAIQSKIHGLEHEATSEKVQIEKLVNDLIAQEAAGDTKGQAETEKLLAQMRSRQENIKSQIEVFTASLADKGFVRPGLKEVFELANYAQEERVQEDARKNAEIQTLEQQLLDLREKLLQLHGSARASSQQQQRDLREIASLLPLIERRPIEQDQEVPYLRAFTQGARTEALEQYLSRPEPALSPQQLRDGIVIKLPPQSGQMGETRDLCRGEHTSSGFIAQQ